MDDSLFKKLAKEVMSVIQQPKYHESYTTDQKLDFQLQVLEILMHPRAQEAVMSLALSPYKYLQCFRRDRHSGNASQEFSMIFECVYELLHAPVLPSTRAKVVVDLLRQALSCALRFEIQMYSEDAFKFIKKLPKKLDTNSPLARFRRACMSSRKVFRAIDKCLEDVIAENRHIERTAKKAADPRIHDKTSQCNIRCAGPISYSILREDDETDKLYIPDVHFFAAARTFSAGSLSTVIKTTLCLSDGWANVELRTQFTRVFWNECARYIKESLGRTRADVFGFEKLLFEPGLLFEAFSTSTLEDKLSELFDQTSPSSARDECYHRALNCYLLAKILFHDSVFGTISDDAEEEEQENSDWNDSSRTRMPLLNIFVNTLSFHEIFQRLADVAVFAAFSTEHKKDFAASLYSKHPTAKLPSALLEIVDRYMSDEEQTYQTQRLESNDASNTLITLKKAEEHLYRSKKLSSNET